MQCARLHKKGEGFGDIGSNVKTLHYLLTNKQARDLDFLSESSLAYLQTSPCLLCLLCLTSNAGKAGLSPTMTLSTINWVGDSHSSVGYLCCFQIRDFNVNMASP